MLASGECFGQLNYAPHVRKINGNSLVRLSDLLGAGIMQITLENR